MATTATATSPRSSAQAGFSSVKFALGLCALTVALTQLLGQVFHQNLLDWYRQDAAQARQLATSVPVFWDLGEKALDTRVELRRGENFEAMRQAHLMRLAMNPANARYWSRYAVDLQRYHHQGEALEQAVTRTLQLAPHSIETALEQSVIAAFNWRDVSEPTRQTWDRHLELALDQPKVLLYHANRSGVAQDLCQVPRANSALKDWCTRLPAYQAACRAATKNSDVYQWCARAGLLTP